MELAVIIILSVLFLAFLFWKEYHRKNRANLAFRLVASALAVVALCFIARPISFPGQLDPGKENTAVLLTPGFNKDSLASLKNIPVYSTNPAIVSRRKNVGFVPDLHYFAGAHAGTNKIHILGEGLETEELKALQSHQLVFHPAEVSGLSAVHWNHTIRSGDQLSIQGTFRNPSDKPAKLVLKGLNTTLDSTTIKAGKPQTFELSTRPKLLGEALYSIIAVSGTDTLASEKIPVWIESRVPLKILALASSPGFETKFLKNWLYAEDFAVASRTIISRDKYSTEFLNTEKVNLNRITTALLEKFDLLIGDMAALSAMSAAENNAVLDQLSKGMGLLIRTDETAGAGFYKHAFSLRQTRNVNQKNTILQWDNMKTIKASSPTAQGLEIIPARGEQSLVKDSKNHTLAALRLYGSGRMVISTVNDTYTWVLGNNSAAYSSYWSHILTRVARKTGSNESWSHNGFPSINDQVKLTLETDPGSLPSAVIENSTLHFSQDPAMFFRWSAVYWPSETGWQSVSRGKQQQALYIFDKDDWKSVKAANKTKGTQLFISSRNINIKPGETAFRTYNYEVPAVYFFILFLICCGYLWIEGKM